MVVQKLVQSAKYMCPSKKLCIIVRILHVTQVTQVQSPDNGALDDPYYSNFLQLLVAWFGSSQLSV
jgi:hypothetical protein